VTIEREFETIDLNINVGPQHPATHGVFRMVLTVDGDKLQYEWTGTLNGEQLAASGELRRQR